MDKNTLVQVKHNATVLCLLITKDIAEVTGFYEVDGSHSSIDFNIKHIISDTKGSIMIDSGYVNLENANGPKVFIQIDMNTLTTQNAMRDGHLKEKEGFFNVAKYKTATYEATEVVKNEEGNFAYTAKGKLTLKGVTKDVEFAFNYVGSSEQEYDGAKYLVAGFEGAFEINRKDFGIDGGGAADEVKINVTVEAVKNL
jgi:K(+)-stimulated pyrophosphate-energized sodium pump